jgi:hypothetical protein
VGLGVFGAGLTDEIPIADGAPAAGGSGLGKITLGVEVAAGVAGLAWAAESLLKPLRINMRTPARTIVRPLTKARRAQ